MQAACLLWILQCLIASEGQRVILQQENKTALFSAAAACAAAFSPVDRGTANGVDGEKKKRGFQKQVVR